MVAEYKNTSVYSNTPIRSFYIRYLDLYEATPIQSDPTDEEIVLTNDHKERPDLLSNELYNTPELWWIFALRNPDKIQDPIYDMVPGLVIHVPTRSRAFGILGD